MAVSHAIGPVAWDDSWNDFIENCVRLVLSVHTAAASVQVECSERRSGPLLIRGFGVQVPGGAPVLTCSNASLEDHQQRTPWNELCALPRCTDRSLSTLASYLA